MLDEAPGFAAACRLAGNDTLSRSELERISQRYESTLGGFWVLTGIGRPSRWPELSGERVAATIAQCRSWVDYTILDTSASLENDEEISSDLFAPRRNAAAVTAVRDADAIVAVGSADPVGLSRFLRAHVDLIETASTNDVTVVMNRIRASAIGLNPHAQVTQTLSRFGGIESPVLVPHDQAGLDGAVLSGRTLADSAPRSPARAAIRSMVSSRLVPELPAEPRSLRSRFRLARATG
jgi:MinD-like ATPase involved in chromosome partitioning or flagellar assembly